MKTLLLSVFLCSVYAQDRLQPSAFFQAIQDGEIDVIVDVRSRGEWSTGHVENATLVENLASADFPPIEILRGCETCTLAIMCRSGARATDAITRLQNEFGFNGTLYNALGTHQWELEGFPLVTTTESKTPPCSTTSAVGVCQGATTQALVGGATPEFSLTATPAVTPIDDIFLNEDFNSTNTPSTTNATSNTDSPSATPSDSPTSKPGPSVMNIQEEEGATVSTAQKADSSTTKHFLTRSIVAINVLVWLGCYF